MDLAALRSATLVRMGLPSGDSMFTDDVLTLLVNTAVHDVETQHDWDWLETSTTLSTSAGGAEYAVPSGWRRTITVTHPSGYALRRSPIAAVDALGDATGTPNIYGVSGRSVVLGPTPASVIALKHRYVTTEPTLQADTDTPLLPTVWHTAIVERAAYLGFRRASNGREAEEALSAYADWIAKMKEEADAHAETLGGGRAAPEAAGPAGA